MKRTLLISLLLLPVLMVVYGASFRAPSYPLITHDPYFSIWMNNKNPTLAEATHWTQRKMPIQSMIRIDGKPYRLMGESPVYVPAANYIDTELTATQTTFVFEQDGMSIKLNFLSPLLVEDIDLVNRPLSYVSWEMEAVDGRNHETEIYIDISGYACINHSGQKVTWENQQVNSLHVLKMGTQEQPILNTSGDDVRMDWGYLYLAAPASEIRNTCIGRRETTMDAFANCTELEPADIADQNLRFINYEPVLAMTIPASVISNQKMEKFIMVAYDDIYSVEYFNRKLEGYWKLKFKSMKELLYTAEKEYQQIKNRCHEFDQKLYLKALGVGGDEYATICNLAYRQTMAAHKVVKDENNQPLCFSKENFSNGCMGTVDVFYPAAPYFLLFNNELMKAQTTPIFDYAKSGRWPWPYAPHDIGKYPLGNGQAYGGGEESEDSQMPVEECGNMLILTAAIAKVDGNVDYASKYWQTITQWAEFLKEKGFDPNNQLCTDDFAGHLAHNTNLSIKAVMGLASYSLLCEMKGLVKESKAYRKTAEAMMGQWKKEAFDGDHYRLAFDKPDSWSQKYNMVWDDILGFNLIDEEIEDTEIAFYLKKQNRYGLPLDSRETYTKLDWILWTASLANSSEEFDQFIQPVYDFLNESPSRVPMSDWYWTKSGEIRGFIARSVVGGVYMEMLKDKLN